MGPWEKKNAELDGQVSDEKAWEIAQANEKLLNKIASTQARRGSAGLDFDQLKSAGWEGLYKAAKAFDPSRGFRFSTLAYRAISNHIYAAIRQEMIQKGGSRNKVDKSRVASVHSLEAMAEKVAGYWDGNFTWDQFDFIGPETFEAELIDSLDTQAQFDEVMNLLEGYKDRKAALVFYLKHFKGLTYTAIGEMFGFSYGRAQQLELNARTYVQAEIRYANTMKEQARAARCR